MQRILHSRFGRGPSSLSSAYRLCTGDRSCSSIHVKIIKGEGKPSCSNRCWFPGRRFTYPPEAVFPIDRRRRGMAGDVRDRRSEHPPAVFPHARCFFPEPSVRYRGSGNSWTTDREFDACHPDPRRGYEAHLLRWGRRRVSCRRQVEGEQCARMMKIGEL